MGLFKKMRLFLKPSLPCIRYWLVAMDLWIVNGDYAAFWSNQLQKFEKHSIKNFNDLF